MPKGGARRGAGRKRGPSKVTIERELLAKRILAEQEAKPGRKLAREVLDDFMHLTMGLAAQYQPLPVGVLPGQNQEPNQDKFVLYAKMAMDAAGQLAPFQSPKFKSVTLSVETPPGGALPAPGQQAPGPAGVMAMSAQQAYRLLRDSDVIDIVPNAPKPKPKVVSRG